MEGTKQKAKYSRFKYSEATLSKALQEINSGILSLNKASKQYGIPKSTLHNKTKEKVPNVRKMGPPPVLTAAEEARLENWITSKAKLGFPMHPDEVKDAVQKVLKDCDRPNPFTDDRPGEKWLKLFLKRHPVIAKRNTEIISKSRAAVTEDAIRDWFQELTSYLEKEKLLDMFNDPARVFNADETGVRTCMKSGLVLGPARRDFKNLYEIASGGEKESITVLCNYSASGVAVPPLVVFPYKRIPKELALSVPEGWGIGRSDSGWMTGPTFYEYMANIFYPWLLETCTTFPVILFIDGHKSHYNMELYNFCVEKKIVLYCLYPNATHIVQPCDVSIFRPLKNEWKAVCRRHKQRCSTPITRHNFCPLFKEAFDKAMNPSTIINGFKACGLFPLDANAVDYSKCISSRRKDIFSQQGPEIDQLTAEDHKSSLKVVERFLGETRVREYKQQYDSESNETVPDEASMYSFWKYCRLNVVEQDNDAETDNHNLQEIDVPYEDVFTEQYLNELPLEINGQLYPQVEIDFNGLLRNNIVNQTPIGDLECDQKNPKDELENGHNILLANGTPPNVTETKCNNSPENDTKENVQAKTDCEEIVNSIIEAVFNIVENNFNSTIMAITENKNQIDCDIRNKINIISHIVIKQNTKDKTEEVWNTHLTWPKQEGEVKKRKARAKVPFAITSTNFAEFQREQEAQKNEKEENIRKRKLEKEQKKKDKEARENKSEKKTKRARKPNIEEMDACGSPGKNQVDLNTGDYVTIVYEKKKYPGIITATGDDEYEVSVMEQTGKRQWRWPKRPDQIWYKKENILKKISEPKLLNTRGTYSVQM